MVRSPILTSLLVYKICHISNVHADLDTSITQFSNVQRVVEITCRCRIDCEHRLIAIVATVFEFSLNIIRTHACTPAYIGYTPWLFGRRVRQTVEHGRTKLARVDVVLNEQTFGFNVDLALKTERTIQFAAK